MDNKRQHILKEEIKELCLGFLDFVSLYHSHFLKILSTYKRVTLRET